MLVAGYILQWNMEDRFTVIRTFKSIYGYRSVGNGTAHNLIFTFRCAVVLFIRLCIKYASSASDHHVQTADFWLEEFTASIKLTRASL